MRRKKWRLVLLSISTGFCIWLFWYLGHPATSSVRGTLTQFGDIHLRYDTAQATTYSPLCGCAADMEAANWKGLTVLTQRATIETKGTLPFTEYWISGAMPKAVEWAPSSFAKMQGIVYIFSLSKAERFDPDYLIDRNFPSTYRIVSQETFEEGFATLITKERINVALLGDKPLACWIPAKGSDVSIANKREMFPGSVGRFQIKEGFKSWDEETLETSYRENQEHKPADYPLGDFLGPNVLVWSEDQSAIITTESGSLVEPSVPNGEWMIVALLIEKPPFAARIVAMP